VGLNDYSRGLTRRRFMKSAARGRSPRHRRTLLGLRRRSESSRQRRGAVRGVIPELQRKSARARHESGSSYARAGPCRRHDLQLGGRDLVDYDARGRVRPELAERFRQLDARTPALPA
jgi:hypothetical protein